MLIVSVSSPQNQAPSSRSWHTLREMLWYNKFTPSLKTIYFPGPLGKHISLMSVCSRDRWNQISPLITIGTAQRTFVPYPFVSTGIQYVRMNESANWVWHRKLFLLRFQLDNDITCVHVSLEYQYRISCPEGAYKKNNSTMKFKVLRPKNASLLSF